MLVSKRVSITRPKSEAAKSNEAYERNQQSSSFGSNRKVLKPALISPELFEVE